MNIKMRFMAVVALLTAFTFTASAQKETPITLDSAIVRALKDNPTIKVADKEIELKKVAKTEAWQNLLPSASIDGAIQYNIQVASMKMDMSGQTMEIKMGKDNSNTWNAALQIALPLYAPAVYKVMSLSKSDLELALEKSRASKQDLVNQVTKAYYQLMLAQDSYKVLQENYQLAEDNYKLVEQMYEQGLVSEYDKINAQVQRDNAKPAVVSGKNGVELAQLQLKVLMGDTIKSNRYVITDSLDSYESEIVNIAGTIIDLKDNTSLKQIDLQSELLNKQRKMLQASFQPTLALVGSYQYQSISNTNWNIPKYRWSDAASLTLSLSIPLYKASNFTSLKTNRIQREQLEQTRINTERMLNMQAQSYIDNMTASAEQFESNKAAVELAEKGYQISQTRYKMEKGTSLELANSQVSLTNAKLSLKNTIYEYLIAKTDLEKVLGTNK